MMGKKGSDRLLFIDGLRGCAALSVVFFHLYFRPTSAIHVTLARLPEFMQWVLNHGFLGVEVFFVLSGFVISRSVRWDRIDGGFLGNFALRRSIRLDPPYWLIVGVAVTLKWVVVRSHPHAGWFGGSGFTWPDILANFTYLHTLLGYNEILGVSWTLCLEVMFYLTYILLLGVAQQLSRRPAGEGVRPSTRALLVVFMPAFSYSLWCWYVRRLGQFGGDHSGFHAYQGYWHMFMIGAILQWSLDGWVARNFFIVSAVVMLLLSAGQAYFVPWSADIRGSVAAVTAIAIFMCGWLNKWDRWLAGPVIQAAGKISYSLYLVHVPICTVVFAVVVGKLGQSVMAVVVGVPIYLGLAWGAAYLLNRFVEQPSIRFSHRFRRVRGVEVVVEERALRGSSAEVFGALMH